MRADEGLGKHGCVYVYVYVYVNVHMHATRWTVLHIRMLLHVPKKFDPYHNR